jgi:hypothetical protein
MNAEAAQVIVAEGRTPKREGNAVSVPAVNDASGIMTMIAAAARDPNVDVDKMTKLYDIRDRELARCAKQAFATAMAEFKKNPPKILKDKHVEFTTGKGVTAYDHATLGNVCAQVINALAAVEISHRWDLDQRDNCVTVTCVLTHAEGHETRTPFIAGRDDTGSKNNIQAIGSAVTYAQRYTLLAAVGLAAENDDDGRGAGPTIELVSDEQAANLQALITEVSANKTSFLAYFKADRIADVPADRYSEAVRMLERKRATPANATGAGK